MIDNNLHTAVAALVPLVGRQDTEEFKEALHAVINTYASMMQEAAMHVREDSDRTVPIRMQITMSCFSEDELIGLERFISAKLEPCRMRKKQEFELRMRKMEAMKLSQYQAKMAQMNSLPTGTITIVDDEPSIKTSQSIWQKIINRT